MNLSSSLFFSYQLTPPSSALFLLSSFKIALVIALRVVKIGVKTKNSLFFEFWGTRKRESALFQNTRCGKKPRKVIFSYFCFRFSHKLFSVWAGWNQDFWKKIIYVPCLEKSELQKCWSGNFQEFWWEKTKVLAGGGENFSKLENIKNTEKSADGS